jgi:hypothetical protein
MSEIERIGVSLMGKDRAKLSVRSDGQLVTVVNNFESIGMTVSEAKAWREGLSRAIRQAEKAASVLASAPSGPVRVKPGVKV